MNKILSIRFTPVLRALVRPVAVVGFVLCLMMAGTGAQAQLSGKGGVSGTVLDPTGAAVPGATISIKNTLNGIVTTATSSSSGDYTVTTLDAGVYVITVTANGFEKLVQKDVHVNALETQTFSPKLTVGASDTEVTVSTLPPQLETTNATLGATMENDMYSALPIEMGAYGSPDQRRATDFAFLMPGVQGNNTNGNPTTNTGIVNGSGNKGAVSDVYIDGLPFVRAGGEGDPRYVWTAISVDAVDQFQLQTDGYSAIYEGQGLQNYTIKAGGTQFHGTAYEFFRNTALDTWGFFGPNITNPITGAPTKPIEHSNEYGISLNGPLVPFGSLKDKLFFFGNYDGFRYSSQSPTTITFPTAAQQAGNFQGVIAGGIYDPSTQAACTANSTNGPCRYRYGYVAGAGTGAAGNPILGPNGAAGVDVIPTSEFSSVAQKMQSYLPTSGISTALQNNYEAANSTGLTNWSTTERIDYAMTPKDTLTLLAAIGRQASSVPVGQTTSGRNVGPVPYNFGQAYAPKTAVGIIEEAHTFTPHLVNQFKYGYARYNGPTIDADLSPAYAATAQGISGLPTGGASQAFPFVTFSGTNAPTGWAGAGPNVTLAANYTLVDNLQWVKGNHTLTAGLNLAWMLYNVVNAQGGSTPLTLANSVNETAELTASSNAAPKYTATPGTGAAYASFLVGQIDKASFTQYVQTEFGTRFRPISPYVQDNWKVNEKLTLDLGLRWDYYPTLTEVHNAQAFFDPTLANPVTGLNGALQYAGSGPGTCNCSTPVKNYFKNFGPRLGLAYQVDPKTVIHASYGVMYAHGNAVGGGATSLSTLGFSAAPAFSATGQLLSSAPFTGANGALPAYAAACGTASGPAYGTGYTNVSSYATPGCGTASYTGSPQSGSGYYDPYLGGRAPQYINYTLGFQHQWTSTISSTITYVGSQGHFLPTTGSARGLQANQLDPQYLSLGSNLSLTGTALRSFCAANTGVCPAAALNVFSTSQSLAALLKPYPFQNVSDAFGYVGNENYHALQATLNMRPTHGITFMANYTWSRSIDDGGTFRTGYAIPAAYSNTGSAYAADAIERTVSETNQPQHVVITGVWQMPFGRTIANKYAVERAILGGFKFSQTFQAYSGSPLAITATGSGCNVNPAESTCMPNYNSAFTGPARINGKWGQGVTRTTYNSATNVYIDKNAFAKAPDYTFGNSARTAPYNIYGPGNYQEDIALVRTFPLHITSFSSFDFRAEMYNVTNHTQFTVASAVFGNGSFGQVSGTQANTRRSAQFSARLNF